MNKKRGILIILLICILSSFYAGIPAEAGILESYDLFRGVKREVMPNGLTVITLVNEGTDLVSINFFVRTGSINECEDTTGISHFCEHMFYRHSSHKNQDNIKQEIEYLGGVFNAETSRDYTRYYVDVQSEYGMEALAVYSDAFMNIDYERDLVDKERRVILEELSLFLENHIALMQTKIYQIAFGDHAYHRPVIGEKRSIDSFSADDLARFKQKWYSPENTAIIIVGDFNEKEYLARIKNMFGKIPGGERYFEKKSYIPLEEKKEIIESAPREARQAIFLMGYRSPGIIDRRDVIAMDILIFMLGQGKNSLFHKELCQQKKLADGVGASYLTTRDPGMVMFSAEIENENVEPLKESILEIMEKLKTGDFTHGEMDNARNLLVRSFIYGAQTNNGKAEALGYYEMIDDMSFAVDYIKMVNSMKKEEVINAAKKYFNDNYILYVQKTVDEES